MEKKTTARVYNTQLVSVQDQGRQQCSNYAQRRDKLTFWGRKRKTNRLPQKTFQNPDIPHDRDNTQLVIQDTSTETDCRRRRHSRFRCWRDRETKVDHLGAMSSRPTRLVRPLWSKFRHYHGTGFVLALWWPLPQTFDNHGTSVLNSNRAHSFYKWRHWV